MTTEEIYQGLLAQEINLRGHVTGQIKTKCPKCSSDRKNKSDQSLSVNIDEGTWTCHHCNWQGGVKTKIKEEAYVMPKINNTALRDDSLAYFKKRGIGQDVINAWKITESEDDQGRWINFNYFEKGELINVKFRGKDKVFRMSRGAKLIFYGLDMIKDSDYCVITEGEFDAISFYQAGVAPACSVPNGASKANNNLKYLDNSWSHFENKKKIVLATDNDEPGIALKKELCRRLGNDRCYEVDFGEHKDANEVLQKLGPKKLKEIYDQAKPIPLDGISTVEDVEKDLNDLYQYGYPKGAKTGWKLFDNHLSFLGGQFTTITGVPGSGKSEFMDNLAFRLNHVNGWKFGVFSPENAPLHYHAGKLCEKFAMKRMSGFDKMSVDEYAQAKYAVNENFFWINFKNEDLSITGILNKFGELVKRYGIKGGIIDPWNQVENKIPRGMTETQFIGTSLYDIMNFCLKYDFHVFLIGHPTKLKKNDDGNYDPPTLYDISGSAHFFNKTYNGFTVHRTYDTAHEGYLDDATVFINKVKFKWCGRVGRVEFQLNKHTTHYEEKDNNVPFQSYVD